MVRTGTLNLAPVTQGPRTLNFTRVTQSLGTLNLTELTELRVWKEPRFLFIRVCVTDDNHHCLFLLEHSGSLSIE